MYLNHNNVQGLNTLYINTTTIAQGLGKPVVMFETNTASCGGFSGLSDSFVAAMWTIDYSLNMAMTNFSHALYHVGGQTTYYNVRRFSLLFARASHDVHPAFHPSSIQPNPYS